MSDDGRKALIIGNDNYENIDKLELSIKDASLMNNTLQALGFQTTMYHDLTNYEMKHKIRDFGDDLEDGQVIFFYYSGHAGQRGQDNYIFGVDTEEEVLEQQPKKEVGGVSLKKTVFLNFSEHCIYIIVIDACRIKLSEHIKFKFGSLSKTGLDIRGNPRLRLDMSCLPEDIKDRQFDVIFACQSGMYATEDRTRSCGYLAQALSDNMSKPQKWTEALPNVIKQVTKESESHQKPEVKLGIMEQIQFVQALESAPSASDQQGSGESFEGTSKSFEDSPLVGQLQKEIAQLKQQLVNQNKLNQENSTKQIENQGNNSIEMQNYATMFQLFKIARNKKIINLQQFQNLIVKQNVNNVTLNLTENDFDEEGRIRLQISKQQEIQGLTISANCFKQLNQIKFQIDCSIIFVNCDFNQVEVIVECNERGFFFKEPYHQVDLQNIICRNTESAFLNCLEICRAGKVIASNISVENKQGKDGLWLRHCTEVQLQRVFVDNCIQDGISIDDCYLVSVTDSSFTNCGERGCWWYKSCGRMLNCNIQNCNTGIYLDGSSVYGDDRCKLLRNQKDVWLIERSE